MNPDLSAVLRSQTQLNRELRCVCVRVRVCACVCVCLPVHHSHVSVDPHDRDQSAISEKKSMRQTAREKKCSKIVFFFTSE